ncbi:beta-N-acetylhexosaminidase [Priestia megaterium]|nr:beta-N-acetylhexosaminidase [Priestia megaterium]
MMKKSRKWFPYLLFLAVALVAFTAVIIVNQSAAPEKEENKSEQQVRDVSSEKEPNAEETAGENGSPPKEAKVTFFQKESDDEKKVTELIESMTLEEKIGQLLVVGFQSNEVDDHVRKMISNYHVGGIILYDRNMKTPKQVASLTNDLQDLALKNDHQIPLMITIDQEGGPIVRMKEHVSPLPSQQELGKKGNQTEIYDIAYRNGKELSAMGIHVNFAPVLDLSATDKRSFGTDPEQAGAFGEQAVKGLTDADVTGALKHFPGHGRSQVDPHVETSSVQADKLDLENKDIYPFKKMINEVDHNRFFVMVTHIKYPAYDKENPASISPVIIQDLLRKKLGYTGIVVTDDLEMGAVNKYFTYEDLGFKAVESGADLLLVCHTLENQQKVFNGIKKAVKANKLSEDRIDEAVKRILTYKLHSLKTVHVNPVEADKLVGK